MLFSRSGHIVGEKMEGQMYIHKKRYREIWIALIALLIYLGIAFFVNINYFIDGTIMAGGDGEGYLNSAALFSGGFSKGEPVLWNRFSMMGTPYMADIQTAYFYPLVYLSLLFPADVFGNVFYVSVMGLGGFFMFLYMKELLKNRGVAFLIGILFMFSVVMGGMRVAHRNIPSTIIWLPLVLFFIQKYIKTRGRRNLLWAAVVMAIQFFAGFPQTMVYSSIFAFLYLVIFIEKDQQYLKKYIVDILLWIILFVALIAIQLLPLAELMKETGRERVGYNFFASYSMSYKVLPMIFFPELYAEVFHPFGENSAEMSIEIYTGVICAIVFIYALVYHFKEKTIRWFSIFGLLAVLFSMCGTIPYLGELVWKIPILGSFRVLSRMLFIYVFFACAVMGLILIKLRERQEAKRLLKFSIAMLAVFILVAIAVKGIAGSDMASEDMKVYYNGLKVFMPTFFFTLALIGILAAYCYCKFFYKSKHALFFLAALICAVNTIDVCRYSLWHNSPSNYEELLHSDGFSEMQWIKEQEGSDEFRSVAAITSFDNMYEAKVPEFKYNASMYHQFPTYNAYLTFEDEPVKDFTKLGYSNAYLLETIDESMITNNAALSASSIKYIADPFGNITENQVIVGKGSVVKEIPEITIPSDGGELTVQQSDINIEKNKYYWIEFEADTSSSPLIFYVDFFGEGYDSDECQTWFRISEGKETYRGGIYSGNMDLPENVFMRILTQGESDIEVANFKVYEAEVKPFDTVYRTAIESDDTTIYENLNAQPIINVPEGVQDNSEYDSFQVADISYIENVPKALDGLREMTKVTSIVIEDNYVKANVSAQSETFVNHSQAMYPGWHAHVDGKKVQNYRVNDTTQGAYVPAGEHVVEFRFEPDSFYLGFGISCAGVILLVYLLLRDKGLEKRKKEQQE